MMSLIRKTLTLAFTFSLLITLIISYLLDIELLYSVYEYREERTIINLSKERVKLSEDLIRIILPPDIKDWQKLDNYTIYINERKVQVPTKLNNDDNKVIELNEYKVLKPGQKINITYIFYIKVVANLLSLPIRVKSLVRKGKGGTIADIPMNLREYCVPLNDWDWNTDDKWSVIGEIIWNISKSENVADRVISAVKWIKEHIAYAETPTVLSPLETIKKKAGDCADQAALITTLLRALGIPSYVAIAMYYEPNTKNPQEGDRITVHEEGFLLHAFAMAFIPYIGWVPIDLTSTAASVKEPEDYINKAAIVMTDRIIVTALVKVSDPNEYLIFTVPKGINVKMKCSLQQVYHPLQGLLEICVIFVIVFSCIMFLLLIISKLEKTSF